jgi:hypothetical protein
MHEEADMKPPKTRPHPNPLPPPSPDTDELDEAPEEPEGQALEGGVRAVAEGSADDRYREAEVAPRLER